MGLNIGIRVLAQDEGFMSHGSNPKGTMEEVDSRFFDFLNAKFPQGGFGRGGVSKSKRYDGKEWWDFDVRMASYSSEFGDKNEMYVAIFEFIVGEFGVVDGLDTQAYWNG